MSRCGLTTPAWESGRVLISEVEERTGKLGIKTITPDGGIGKEQNVHRRYHSVGPQSASLKQTKDKGKVEFTSKGVWRSQKGRNPNAPTARQGREQTDWGEEEEAMNRRMKDRVGIGEIARTTMENDVVIGIKDIETRIGIRMMDGNAII